MVYLRPGVKYNLSIGSFLKKRALNRLFHLAEASNWPSIQRLGLMSTRLLLDHTRKTSEISLRSHRPESIQLSKAVTIRDQKPMPPAKLATALGDDLVPEDWYELLNGFVFLWPDRDRLMRHLRACQNRAQILLTFDAAAIISDFGDQAYLSAINTGNARRRPAMRDRSTFVPIRTWLEEGFPKRKRTTPPAEFVLACPLPAVHPYLLEIKHIAPTLIPEEIRHMR